MVPRFLKTLILLFAILNREGRVVQYTRTVTVRIIHVMIRTDHKDLKKWRTVRKGPDTTIFTKLNKPSLSNTCPVSITSLPETCLK